MTIKNIHVELNAAGKKIVIVAAKWNSIFVEQLVSGAQATLLQLGIKEEDITICHVPGSYEIPLACRSLAKTQKYDGIIALGCLIKGETDHYDLIAKEVTSGIAKVMHEFSLPISFGVLTVNNMEQAMSRSGSKMGNKGVEAAQAVIEMSNLLEKIKIS